MKRSMGRTAVVKGISRIARRLLWVLAAALPAGHLFAQVPPGERIPVVDPDRLQRMGFPRDAGNVFAWSRADLRTGKGPEATSTPKSWGTSQHGFSTVLGYALQERNTALHLNRTTTGCFCPTGDHFFDGNYALAQIEAPEGARLDTFKFWAYDTVSDQDLTFRVWETCQDVGLQDPPTETLLLETSTLSSIGSYNGGGSLNGLTVNNRLCAYSVQVEFAPVGQNCNSDLEVRKLQFIWTRQVSPAPATATFNDVPTDHPFFQFVEALAKSAITGGCSASPPLYCPDAPLTRGQMAVFLAKALGLQWP